MLCGIQGTRCLGGDNLRDGLAVPRWGPAILFENVGRVFLWFIYESCWVYAACAPGE